MTYFLPAEGHVIKTDFSNCYTICTLLSYSDHVESFNLLVGIIKEDDNAAYTASLSS